MFNGLDIQFLHVALPSLSDFWFSHKQTETAWKFPWIADARIKLLDRLGYDRWEASGFYRAAGTLCR